MVTRHNIQLSYTSDDLQMIRGNFNADLFLPGDFETLFLDPPSNITSFPQAMNLFYDNYGLSKLEIPYIITVFEGTAGYSIVSDHVIAEEFNTPWLASDPVFPNARSVEGIKRLLEYTTGRILDPFAGAGSTLIAARQLGREAVGLEPVDRCHDMFLTALEKHGDPS